MRALVGLGLIVGLGTVVVPPDQAEAATPPGYWVESAYTSVFKDSGRSEEAADVLKLDTARNDYEGGQVVLRGPSAYTINGVDFSELAGPSDSIAATNLSYNFVGYQSLNRNSTFDGVQPAWHTIRDAPGLFPDRLVNDPTIAVDANTTQSVWIRVFVPAEAAGGVYSGRVTVRTTAGNIVVPLTVNARAVTIPPAKDGGFTNVMWQSTSQAIYPDPAITDTIEEIYKYKKYSTKWWELIDRQAEITKRYRGNSVQVQILRLLIDAGSVFNSSTGKYTFNWTLVDQLVEHYQAHGAVKRLEGNDLIGSSPRFKVATFPTTPGGFQVYYDWDSPAGKNWTDQYLPALRDHVAAKGWQDLWFQHISDESQDVEEYNEVATRYRQLWPGIKIADAIVNAGAFGVAKTDDIVIPNLHTYTENRDPFDYERTTNHKELWFYNCNIPVFGHLNRFIDEAQWNQRMTMWLAYSRGATGYLHWAYNNWRFKIDDQKPKGDGWITQPDVARNTLEVTTRYESLRDGIEDWEVLNLLGKTNPGLARELSRSLVEMSNNYQSDISYMQRIRAMVLDAAAGKPLIPQDLAVGKTATASSGDATKAVDGDAATAWQPTGTGEQWVQVDLGRQVQLNGVQLSWTAAPASYKVQLSYDGSSWSDAHAVSVADKGYFAGINGKARYVRIVVPAGGVGLAGLEVSGAYLLQQNFAGGKSYSKPGGTSPGNDDAGKEATDGVLSHDWNDRRGFAYDVPNDNVAHTYDVTVDLGVVQTVGRAKAHAYEDFPGYQPDRIKISTSGDGRTYTEVAQTGVDRGMYKMWYQADFAPTRARFVRFSFVKTRSGAKSAVYFDDLEVYGVGSVPAATEEVPGSAGYKFGSQELMFAPTTTGSLMRWNWAPGVGTKTVDWGQGPIAGRPSGYVWLDQQHAIARSTDGKLLHWWQADGQAQPSFANWAGDAASDPVAAVWGGQQHIFARSSDSAISHWWWDPVDQKLRLDKWSGAPGPIVGRPAVYTYRDQLHVVARGTDNHLYHWWWIADEFEPHFADWGGETYSDPTAFTWQGQQHVFAQAADGQLQHWWWDPADGLKLDRWTGASGKFVGAPAGFAFGEEQHVVARGPNNTLYTWFWGKGNNLVTFADRGGAAYSDPVAYQFGDQQQIFAQSATNTLSHWWWTPTEAWQNDNWGGSVRYQP
ncbi:glycoside hydrolase domain-containing protein [Kribbella sp. NPDC051587]|uniref:glycoside hydrolase domain-containing protein n=1 Tax=Kribbella sp. NPDC051587 TaxID=3364119 RepID=UPI0037AC37DC